MYRMYVRKNEEGPEKSNKIAFQPDPPPGGPGGPPPPGGFPGGPSPGGFPGGPPPGGFPGGRGGPPSGPPPSVIPQRERERERGRGGAAPFAVDPGAIRFCLYRFTYVWPRRGRPFWFYPVFLGRRSVAGFRWTGREWVYFGIDLRQIDFFQCT